MTGRQRIQALIQGNEPDRIVYSPNIWQWFFHQKFHNKLPKELSECETLIDAHIVLGEDCFSRNLASDQRTQWYGGFTDVHYNNVEIERIVNGPETKIIYHTTKGDLDEEFFYDENGSTLIQKKFLLDKAESQLPIFKELIAAKHFNFCKEKWDSAEKDIGELGMNIFGDLCNSLKLFHFACDPVNTTYLLYDVPEQVMEIIEIYTDRCLEVIKQAIEGGVKVVMTMDNLGSVFYPPPYFKLYCQPFFKKISELCHANDVILMSHACGQVKDLLNLCEQAGLDGLEGVTPPPLGDVELYEAKKMTNNNFICNGGITPLTQKEMKSKQDVYDFTRYIFEKLEDRKRFVYSMSCNTTIDTSYDIIRWFGEATRDLSSEIFG